MCPKASEDWDISCFPPLIKLRRNLMTTSKEFSASQESSTHEVSDKNDCILHLCAPDHSAE